MGDFKHVDYTAISEFKGRRFAVDASILLNKLLRSDADKIASTNKPMYAAPDLVQSMMEFHKRISQWITPVYVFDGLSPDLKAKRRLERQQKREKDGERYLSLLGRAKKDKDAATFTEEEIEEATSSRMKMSHPTSLDHAAALRWMKAENIECCGSYGEADQQMVRLEKDGIVDGIISEDGDEVALGAKLLLTKMSRKSNGEFQFKVFEREKLLSPGNPYNSKLCKHHSLITDTALLLGNDYIDRVKGNGAATVLGSFPTEKKKKEKEEDGQKKRKHNNRGKERLGNGMIDRMASADNIDGWLKQFGARGQAPLSSEAIIEIPARSQLHAICTSAPSLRGNRKGVSRSPERLA